MLLPLPKEHIIEAIDISEATELLKAVISIPSESRKEHRLCEFLLKYFKDVGYETYVDSHGNCFAELTNDRPIVLLNTHMDTVPAGEGWDIDPFAGALKNGCVYGRGACDAKGSLVSMMMALRSIRRSGIRLKGSLLFMGAVTEEISPPSEKGTMKAISDGITADMAIVGEPTDLEICIAEFGRMEYEITTYGRSAHANAPEEGINAIVYMAELVRELNRRIQRPYSELLGRAGTFNVGVIRGGIQSNIVPERCTVLVDRGLVPGQTPEDSLKEMHEIADGLKKNDSNFRFEIRTTYEGYPAAINPNEPIVQVLLRNLEYVTGQKRKPTGFVSHCDADWLITFGKIPSVIFGPGSLRHAHKANEHVDVSQVVNAARILAASLVDLLS